MTVLPTDDHLDDDQVLDSEGEIDDTDLTEVADTEEDATGTAVKPPADLDPEIEQEIKRVIVEEEPVKKAPMLPETLINKELEPDDLFDAGSI